MRLDRKTLLALVLSAAIFAACGFDGEGTATPAASTDGGAPEGSAPVEAGAADAPVDAGAPRFDPSHVPSGVTFDDAAADVSGGGAINTSNTPTMTGLPAGARIEVKGDVAVLFVKNWNVTAPVTVGGDRPLVILASGSVTITSSIDAGAKGTTKGPGGSGPGGGKGKGGDGNDLGLYENTGGGGASFGGTGARGGADGESDRGTAGSLYGAMFTDFAGGSGGGEGSPQDCGAFGRGGAGGGAVQISARLGISLGGGAWINAGGGGGRGGCMSMGQSGGGGGSGGSIVLEAPSMVIAGALAANGGGGGAGGSGPSYDGLPGANAGTGLPAITAAPGGSSPPPGFANAEGVGGAGAIEGAAAVSPPLAANNQGGGGGGVGRIWLRTLGKAPMITGKISPAPVMVP